MTKSELIKKIGNSFTVLRSMSLMDRYESEKWISVEDRLPEKGGKYLVCLEYIFNQSPNVIRKSLDIDHFVLDVKGWESQIYGTKHPAYKKMMTVIAWQPLPEPPK